MTVTRRGDDLLRRSSFLLAALLLTAAAGAGCHGHRVPARFAAQYDRDFDLSRPPCDLAPRPAREPGDLVLRYLGLGGVVMRWGGAELLTAPFFSNPGIWTAAFGDLSWNGPAIRRGMKGTRFDDLRAVLVGHAHYDHLGDLPWLLREGLVPSAPIYANASAVKALASYPEIADLAVPLEGREGEWQLPAHGPDDDPPFRVLPVPGGHVAHVGPFHYAPGDVDEPFDEPWPGVALRRFRQGTPYAFVIELLETGAPTTASPDRPGVAYRIYYQDASSLPEDGLPPSFAGDGGYDLAILCMASFHKSGTTDDGRPRYPERLLRHLRPRHVLIVHYEDFFRSIDRPIRFAPFLTDDRVETFLESVRRNVDAGRATLPHPLTCGPSHPGWTLPLPGEWVRFRIP